MWLSEVSAARALSAPSTDTLELKHCIRNRPDWLVSLLRVSGEAAVFRPHLLLRREPSSPETARHFLVQVIRLNFVFYFPHVRIISEPHRCPHGSRQPLATETQRRPRPYQTPLTQAWLVPGPWEPPVMNKDNNQV